MSLIDQLRGDELASLTSEVAADRRDHILKSLDERGGAQELVRQQYSGRYPFELIQNANDAAADADRPGRVRFVLTDSALVVADNGAGFGADQVRAICGLGRSSKDPRKSVGYKGLGFKSVGEITSRPQIFSGDTAFEFDEQRVFQVVAEVAGPLAGKQRLPVYAFPFPVELGGLGPDSGVVTQALADGYHTVVRLPLKEKVVRSEVEAHLIECLMPRLLLFLTAIGELELRGTSKDFVTVVTHEQLDQCNNVLLKTSGLIEQWLVYRREIDVDRSLVAPLGDAWAEVERVHVAVAVALDPGGRPIAGQQYPLHVYFPTEERTGLPVVIHGDFALQFDRKQLATNPEAVPYNESLLDAAAALFGSVVAPALADRHHGDAAAVAVLTPRGTPTGLGEKCLHRCVAALRTARFLPGIDGKARVPAEALLLPNVLPDPARAHAHLDISGVGRLLVPAVEADRVVRSFLRDKLGVSEWPLNEVLNRLTIPAHGKCQGFYEMLVEWGDALGVRQFAAAISNVRCVQTAAGAWVTPSERVFFPRQRDDVEIPADLPVRIAAVPDVEGLEELLTSAGVRKFDWGELLTGYLLPLLTSSDTDCDLRHRALNGLRAYYSSQRSGDPRLRRRILEVLLMARSVAGGNEELQPAGSIYFGSDWSGSAALEKLYGPFGKAEFLATKPPADSDESSAERSFLAWVGVADHPRVLEAHTDQPDVYMCANFERHPHRKVPGWDSWWKSGPVKVARDCIQGHPWGQQLRVSWILDRFVQLTEAGDPQRMLILWQEMAQGWGKIYEPATQAVFSCRNTSHGGERDRVAPSLFHHILTTTAWVPVLKGEDVALVRPHEAWRLAPDTPKSVAKRVPVLDRKMVDATGVGLAAALHVIDAARPSPQDIAGLLNNLRQECETPGERDREIHSASRWAMRTLNDALKDSAVVSVEEVPLLSRYRGKQVFATDPVVALDPLLAETWEEHYPILDADRDFHQLHKALGLRILDDPETGVKVIPVPHGVREDLRPEIKAAIDRAKPFLAAVADASTRSRRSDVVRGLVRLEILVCDELVLRYSFEGRTIERSEAVSYIAVRQESGLGAIRRNIGTAHLEIDSQTKAPNWYAFGPQLAQFLKVPTLGDSFAVLLMGNDHDRNRYLASRRVPAEAVAQMRVELDLPPDDDLSDNVFDFLDVTGQRELTLPQSTAPEQVLDDQLEPSEHDAPLPHSEGAEPLPDLNLAGVTIKDADAGEVQPHGIHSGGSGGLGPSGSVDHESSDQRAREIGRRGEQTAIAAEKKRVEAFGGDPLAVVWRSERNQYAPYDIESLDEDGQRIYIEVKSTTSADPADPFIISHAELLQALRHRSRFYIYRVTAAGAASPQVHRFQDPARLLIEGRADLRLSDARMSLGQPK